MPGYTSCSCNRRCAGTALIGILIFIGIGSTMLAGVANLAIMQYKRTYDDAIYAHALDLADAGADWEINRLTLAVANADTTARTVSPAFGVAGASYTVQCVNRGTSAAWSGAGTSLDIVSTGTMNGVTRTVRVAAKGAGANPSFAVFGMDSFKIHASNPTINGDIGTNAAFSLHGHVSGSAYVCGPGASGSGAGANCPTVVLPNAVVYPTIDQVALGMFPNSGATSPGGLSYLATHNDNALSSLPVSTASVTGTKTLAGKSGTANYYLTSVNLVSASVLTIDNSTGPVNVWVGPKTSSSMVNLDNTAQIVTRAPITTNPVTFYVATTGGVQMHSSPTTTCFWYVYNKDSSGADYGDFSGWNSPTVNGAVICGNFFNSGDTLINYSNGVACPLPPSYYAFDNSWLEVKPR